ncbi:MAG: hypothetical protein FWC27_10660 [Firmicutes bacterium]|nr:hypothetical protein [Bacillota bacterium]
MKNYAHRYQKLGGWLLTIVIFTFIGAFSNVVSHFNSNGFLRVWPNYQPGEFWMQLVIVICMLYIGALQITYAVMIIRRDPRFARIWQLIYIGSFLKQAATMMIHLGYGYPEVLNSEYSSNDAVGLIADIIILLLLVLGFFLFTQYFRKSVRLRTYMGSDKYLKLAFFTKKTEGPVPMVPDLPAEQEDAQEAT